MISSLYPLLLQKSRNITKIVITQFIKDIGTKALQKIKYTGELLHGDFNYKNYATWECVKEYRKKLES